MSGLVAKRAPKLSPFHAHKKTHTIVSHNKKTHTKGVEVEGSQRVQAEPAQRGLPVKQVLAVSWPL